MFGIRESEVERKSKLFRETIRNYVIAFQSNRYPNCEDIIMKNVNQLTKDAYDEIRDEWGANENYQELGLTSLYNITFDMVTSGHYHFYAGMLTPQGRQIERVCKGCLEAAKAAGIINDDVYNDQMSTLNQSIRHMG